MTNLSEILTSYSNVPLDQLAVDTQQLSDQLADPFSQRAIQFHQRSREEAELREKAAWWEITILISPLMVIHKRPLKRQHPGEKTNELLQTIKTDLHRAKEYLITQLGDLLYNSHFSSSGSALQILDLLQGLQVISDRAVDLSAGSCITTLQRELPKLTQQDFSLEALGIDETTLETSDPREWLRLFNQLAALKHKTQHALEVISQLKDKEKYTVNTPEERQILNLNFILKRIFTAVYAAYAEAALHPEITRKLYLLKLRARIWKEQRRHGIDLSRFQ